jgi:hypothetical protein
MQRFSESIGAIAAALAKAQAELTNPEKSLTATIRASNPRESDKTFRYAALSSGLEIVRKALGLHEIATVQATAIDQEAGLIRLTTTLAHSSGEWLSSERPVCPVSETASPRRMGAALTYARRYALFTLVGIAGEDDLDAPDLNADDKADLCRKAGLIPSASGEPEVDKGPAVPQEPRRAKIARTAKIALTEPESAAERARMIAEIERLQSSDEAADWVYSNLPVKNASTPEDGDVVGATFQKRLAAIEERADSRSPEPDGNRVTSRRQGPAQPSRLWGRRPRKPPSAVSAELRARQFVYATRNTANSWPRNLASFAAAPPQRRITLGLLNRGQSAGRSATNSPSRFAASIIASCTTMATSPRGGRRSTSIRCRLRLTCGDSHDHPKIKFRSSGQFLKHLRSSKLTDSNRSITAAPLRRRTALIDRLRSERLLSILAASANSQLSISMLLRGDDDDLRF